MTALADDLVALLRQRQAVDFDHIVQHAGEHLHHLAIGLPVESRIVGERIDHEFREIHRTQKTGSVRGQRLFPARIGGANVLGPPVVVHLVHFIDEDEAGLGKIIGGGHDHVPHAARRQGLIDLAGNQAILVDDVAIGVRPFAPYIVRAVLKIRSFAWCAGLVFLLADRKRKLPFAVALHGLHEIVADQQGQVELPQPAVFALGANELQRVRVSDIEGAHLSAAAAAGRRHGKAHLVVDIHERQRTGRIGAGTRHVGAARPQGRKFIADSAAGFEREAGLMHLVQDVVHGIADRPGDGAIDRRGRGLVLQGAGVRGDAAGRNRTVAQCPQERLVPLFAAMLGFHIGERTRDALIGIVHRLVDGRTILRRQTVLLVPDVEGRFLIRNAANIFGLYLDHRIHGYFRRSVIIIEPKPEHKWRCSRGKTMLVT